MLLCFSPEIGVHVETSPGGVRLQGALAVLYQLAKQIPGIARAIVAKLHQLVTQAVGLLLAKGLMGVRRMPAAAQPRPNQVPNEPPANDTTQKVEPPRKRGWFSRLAGCLPSWGKRAVPVAKPSLPSVNALQQALFMMESTKVAAGPLAGTKLHCGPGFANRTIHPKKRAAIFDLLEPLAPVPSAFSGSMRGLRWLDLYSGSGSMGFEALSRGAYSVCFVEKDQATLPVLHRNVRRCKARRTASVHACCVQQYIQQAQKANKSLPPPRFDVISLAPPSIVPPSAALAMLPSSQLLRNRPLVVLEYDHPKAADLPSNLGPLVLARHYRLGDSCCVIYARESKTGGVMQEGQVDCEEPEEEEQEPALTS